MESNSQSRKWLITINQPLEKGYSHDKIKEILTGFKSLIYWCMSDEIGSEGQKFHTHIYIAFSSAVRFSTIKKNFEGGHFDIAKGTSEENRNYVFKEGKWEKDRKKETNMSDTHEEFGDLPVERQGQRNDIHDLYDMIKGGLSNYEIIEAEPNYMLNLDKIERTRQIIKEEKFKSTFRNLEVTYVTGATGTGKTRSVMEEYGYENVFRITDYLHPFDNYKGQDVIIFEEFRSSLKIQDMLNYLDGYPLELPCRYSNKIACFTKVFIITNYDLHEQYTDVQLKYKETWLAFLRRINFIKVYNRDGSINVQDFRENKDMILIKKRRFNT